MSEKANPTDRVVSRLGTAIPARSSAKTKKAAEDTPVTSKRILSLFRLRIKASLTPGLQRQECPAKTGEKLALLQEPYPSIEQVLQTKAERVPLKALPTVYRGVEIDNERQKDCLTAEPPS